jgi:hypothetical protein
VEREKLAAKWLEADAAVKEAQAKAEDAIARSGKAITKAEEASRAPPAQAKATNGPAWRRMAAKGRSSLESVCHETAASMTTPIAIATGATQSNFTPNTAPA